MSLNKLFDTIQETRTKIGWETAFGEPQVVGNKTIIPVAKVGYAFGLGFGQGAALIGEKSEVPVSGEGENEGGGTGGGASSSPLGIIVVTPEHTYFEAVLDQGKISLAGIVLVAWIVFQLAITIRVLLGRR
jgi:uncharacterized spore protein YtfJ